MLWRGRQSPETTGWMTFPLRDHRTGAGFAGGGDGSSIHPTFVRTPRPSFSGGRAEGSRAIGFHRLCGTLIFRVCSHSLLLVRFSLDSHGRDAIVAQVLPAAFRHDRRRPLSTQTSCQIAAFGQHPVGRIAIRSGAQPKVDRRGAGADCSGGHRVSTPDPEPSRPDPRPRRVASCLTVESIESAYRRISWAPAVRHP